MSVCPSVRTNAKILEYLKARKLRFGIQTVEVLATPKNIYSFIFNIIFIKKLLANNMFHLVKSRLYTNKFVFIKGNF